MSVSSPEKKKVLRATWICQIHSRQSMCSWKPSLFPQASFLTTVPPRKTFTSNLHQNGRCSYTACCNLKSGLIPERKLLSRNTVLALPHPPFLPPSSFSYGIVPFLISLGTHCTDTTKPGLALQLHLLSTKILLCKLDRAIASYCQTLLEPTF